jgi:hypothetical protein
LGSLLQELLFQLKPVVIRYNGQSFVSAFLLTIAFCLGQARRLIVGQAIRQIEAAKIIRHGASCLLVYQITAAEAAVGNFIHAGVGQAFQTGPEIIHFDYDGASSFRLIFAFMRYFALCLKISS